MSNLWPKIEEKVTSLPGVGAKDGVVLVGAGFHGQIALDYLREQGTAVSCFADNNPKKQGTKCHGVPVISLEELASRKPSQTLITARHAVRPVSKQLNELGIAHLSFDAYFVQQQFERLQAVRSKFSDERSKHVFDHLLLAMLTGDLGYCREVAEGNQYLALPAFINDSGGYYVDAGAYVGDSIERFIWAHNGVFQKIYAFEPGERQMTALKKRMKRLEEEWALDADSYVCVQAGLGDKEEEKTLFTPPGALIGSTFSNDAACEGPRLKITTLDISLKGERISALKSDIEGMEMPMLRGAAELIETHKPRLALSIYHKPEDLYLIAEYIHSLVPEYRMAVRHHAPSLIDTVLYCWKED